MESAAGGGEVERLRARVYDKLKEQTNVSRQLHALLTAPDGLIEDTRRTCKNLDAAVVASRRPGYFKYHEPTDRVKAAEGRHEVEFLTKRVQEIQREIDDVR